MSDEDFQTYQKKLFFIVALVSVLGGNTGSLLNAFNSDIRYDAWTATEDREAMDSYFRAHDARCTRSERYIDTIREGVHKALSNDAVTKQEIKQLNMRLDYHIGNDKHK